MNGFEEELVVVVSTGFLTWASPGDGTHLVSLPLLPPTISQSSPTTTNSS